MSHKRLGLDTPSSLIPATAVVVGPTSRRPCSPGCDHKPRPHIQRSVWLLLDKLERQRVRHTSPDDALEEANHRSHYVPEAPEEGEEDA